METIFTNAELKKYWGWFVGLGISLIILGAIAIGSSVLTTFISIVLLGWLLIIAGIFETIQSFWQLRNWSGFLWGLLIGILHLVLGIIIVANPIASAQALTLLIAFFLIFGGVLRISTAISMRIQHWGWLLFNGIIVLLLGILVWVHWPYSGLWIIGLFVGIEILLNGWWLLVFGLAAKGEKEKVSSLDKRH
jgi:uncharacterized membrane protein HdeD (DUF308 family)